MRQNDMNHKPLSLDYLGTQAGHALSDQKRFS